MGEDDDDIAVKLTISLKYIVTDSKLSAGTCFLARSCLMTSAGSICCNNRSDFLFSLFRSAVLVLNIKEYDCRLICDK